MSQCAASPNCSKTPSKFKRGMCGAHHRAYLRRARDEGVWRGHVPAGPVQEHLKALADAGVSAQRVSWVTGLSLNTLLQIPERESLWSTTADKIFAVRVDGNFREGGRGMIPVLGSRRRLQSLHSRGFTVAHLAERLGMSVTATTRILRPDDPRSVDRVESGTARKIDALWRELQLAAPPQGPACTKARRRAAKLGWPDPLAWEENEIDDPRARPRIDPTLLTKGRLEEYKKLRDQGLTKKEIAKRFNLNESTLYDWINRQKAKGNL
ncbi:helix-turn-helix DNA binding protein [Mycobacterium phage Thibault]|uniref:Helix-turn-helix DNA binding protein n=1 Tax=Mycobacterium phage Thibault TaxID=1052673 RepID=G1FGH9_9CAUD|nr:helix-turn-helix DNA binding protein [Mycobacterium phage Thibault]AEJ94037.1 helix-turn-helix DNA binding protein [Mycobacterium phage Thibault]